MNGKVLIVDDEPIIGNLLEGGLTENGFEAEYFSSAANALENIDRIRPDIIISDIAMPHMDGYELRRRLRQNPETASIPFIFLSAHSEISDQIKEGLKAGADDYVCKPFKIENLIEHIRSVTERAAKARTFRSQADFSGDLSQTRLNEIMQIVELNHKTGELILSGNSGGKKAGSIFFREGRLMNARKENLEGEEAFFSLSDHTEGLFEFHGCAVEVAELIKSDTVSLLLKAGQMREETRQFRAKLPDPDAVLKLRSRQIPLGPDQGPDAFAAKEILNLITQGKTVQEIIGCGTVSPVRAGSVLSALFDAGIAGLQEAETASDRKNIAPPKVMPETEGFVPSPAGSAIEKGFLKVLKSFDRGALTGVLEIRDRPVKAAVYFQDGQIIHACHGRTTAKKALYRIFSEKGGTFKFRLQPVSVNRSIDGSLKSLLEEGSKEIEGLRRLNPGTFENIVRINPRILEKTSKIEGRPGLKHILSLAEQHGRIEDIMDASQMTDFQTYRHLFYMARLGILSVESDRRPGFQIVTDSTADLPADILADRNIIQLPLSGSQNQKNYSDRFGSTAENFYHSLNFSRPLADSPAEDDFHKLFRQITPDKDVLAIFLSKKISKTYRNAVSAKEKRLDGYLKKRRQTGAGGDCVIEIIDSRSVSLGLGLLVLEAADRAEEGWPIDRVRDHIEKLIPLVRVFFAKDTPAYLEQKGRIGRFRAMFSGLIHTRPILGIWDGEVTAADQARNEKNVRERMAEWIERGLPHPRTPVRVGIMHADVPKWAEQMRAMLDNRLNCRSILMSRVEPSAGSYCGPGTVAVAYFPVPAPESEN